MSAKRRSRCLRGERDPPSLTLPQKVRRPLLARQDDRTHPRFRSRTPCGCGPPRQQVRVRSARQIPGSALPGIFITRRHQLLRPRVSPPRAPGRDVNTDDHDPSVIKIHLGQLRQKLDMKVRRAASLGRSHAAAICAGGLYTAAPSCRTLRHAARRRSDAAHPIDLRLSPAGEDRTSRGGRAAAEVLTGSLALAAPEPG
jgi:hypothetical protein